MTYAALWSALCDAGIEVHARPDGLRVTNASDLTPALRDGLRQHREALLAELRMPLTERTLFVFGGVVTDAAGRLLKRQPGQTLGLTI